MSLIMTSLFIFCSYSMLFIYKTLAKLKKDLKKTKSIKLKVIFNEERVEKEVLEHITNSMS